MSRVAIVFIIYLLVVVGIIALGYFGIISKNIAGIAASTMVMGYVYSKTVGKKDKSMTILKILEGDES